MPDPGRVRRHPQRLLDLAYEYDQSDLMRFGLYAGKHMQKDVDLDAYLASVADHKDGFWLKVASFRADHPVGFRRMVILRRMESQGWDVHGKFLQLEPAPHRR